MGVRDDARFDGVVDANPTPRHNRLWAQCPTVRFSNAIPARQEATFLTVADTPANVGLPVDYLEGKAWFDQQ